MSPTVDVDVVAGLGLVVFVGEKSVDGRTPSISLNIYIYVIYTLREGDLTKTWLPNSSRRPLQSLSHHEKGERTQRVFQVLSEKNSTFIVTVVVRPGAPSSVLAPSSDARS